MEKGTRNFLICLGGLIVTAGLGALIFFNATPAGKAIIARYHHDLSSAEQNNNYQNRKEVEDTCRSYIASYKADKNAYEQYKDSTDDYYKRLAESYRQRANQTATTYNEYFLKNSYVWKDNVPDDIVRELELI